jgi:hypothetical protein
VKASCVGCILIWHCFAGIRHYQDASCIFRSAVTAETSIANTGQGTALTYDNAPLRIDDTCMDD